MSIDAKAPQGHSDSGVNAGLKQFQSLIAGRLRLGLYSKFTRYGLRRDLDQPHTNPDAKIPISVRPLVNQDLPSLLPADDDQLEAQERVLIAWRRSFAKKVPKGCYVAVDLRNNEPCYMQWLIGSADNETVRQLGGFPDLEPQEALLENAYTPPKYRGLSIMSAAMARIAERATDIGARHVLTFVGDDNTASLKGCQRAGFHPHLLNIRVRMAFGLIKSDSFEKLAADDPRRTLRF